MSNVYIVSIEPSGTGEVTYGVFGMICVSGTLAHVVNGLLLLDSFALQRCREQKSSQGLTLSAHTADKLLTLS